MSEFLKGLNERRLNIWNDLQGIISAAETDKRDLTADETARFDQGSTDMEALRGRIETYQSAETANEAAERALAALNGGENRGAPPAGSSDFNEQIRSLWKGEISEFDVTGTPGAAVRALTKGVAGAGGNTVKTSFYEQIVQNMVDTGGVLAAGPTIIETASGESIEVPVTTSLGAATMVAEGGTIAGTDPAFAKRTLGAYKYAQIIQVSKELLQDAVFDVEAFIRQIGGQNLGLALNAHLAVGTGSNQPAGIMTTASAGKTGGAGVAGAFTADDIIDLFYSVAAPYRASNKAGWLFKDSSIAALRKLKDAQGQYLFSPALSIGSPDSVLGKPIYSDPNIASVGLGAKSVGFGDFSKYWVRMAGGLRFERSDEFAFNTDLVSFKLVIRADGLTVDQTGAFKAFVGNAA